MLINAKKLLGLPVETMSKQKLGKICDFDLDIESHIIKSYFIEGGFLGSNKLIIRGNQIVSINNEKMIVKDNSVKEKIAEKKEMAIKPTTEPVLSASASQK